MSTFASAPKRTKEFSVRRNVNRRIFRFSLVTSTAVTVLAVVLLFGSKYPSLQNSEETNRRVLAEVTCTASGCDSSALTTDWQVSDADYVIDTQMSYLLSVPETLSGDAARFSPLDYSDTTFIAKFRHPTTFHAPNGETWRLYSRPLAVGQRRYEIIVGYAEQAPWKMIVSPPYLLSTVDAKLRAEIDKVAATLQSHGTNFHGVKTDGFEIVDADTQRVVEWGPWLPIFLPQNVNVPKPGIRLHVHEQDLYIVQTDTNGRVVVISLVYVGGIWWLALLVGFAFLATNTIVRALARRYLRKHFALRGLRVPSTEEALHIGEGQQVEYKRALGGDEVKTRKSDDEFAETVAAFANTNDGIILIGVDDHGHVRGLNLSAKQRGTFEERVLQLVRNRIKPMPPMDIGFEDLNGVTLAKISVARGDAQAYMMNGVIYVRSGAADVQAQPDDLKRLVAEYGV
jgi:hypothetical protein